MNESKDTLFVQAYIPQQYVFIHYSTEANVTRKMAERSTFICMKICKNCFFLNSDLKQVLLNKEFESMDLGATNGTFVTKGELESDCLTTPT